MNVVMGESAWTPQTHSIGSKSYLSPKMREVKSRIRKIQQSRGRKLGHVMDRQKARHSEKRNPVNVLSNKTEKREHLTYLFEGCLLH